jgi:acetyltransferase-like isoleucine patch superfamily enzyme
MSLNKLSWLRNLLVAIKRLACVKVLGMNIHPTAQLSLRCKLDKTFPKGVHIGAYAYVASGAHILAHDRTRGLYVHTFIGKHTFVGTNSIILPGVRIGDHCVIGAGSIVTKDIPSGSVVAGNPAHVIRSGVVLGRYGRFEDADATEHRLRASDPAAAALPDKNFGKG